jgi:putative component of membrane protein insertase Oxa1/YidC/SpoIIIJ protein YidD
MVFFDFLRDHQSLQGIIIIICKLINVNPIKRGGEDAKNQNN